MSARHFGFTMIATLAAPVLMAGSARAQDRSAQVCSRWTADRADMTEGTWTGDAASCNAGDNVTGRANALKILNLYRFLVDMPEVTSDATLDANAQQCALMQTANNSLNHTPPTTWLCYTDAGATASGRSNISSGAGVKSMDLYMNDSGNATTMGHRRWVLNNQLGPVGLGSAKASCFTNVGGKGNAGKAFVAWPPSGPVPLQAITATKVDTAGWSIQSDTINLNTATVSVTDGTTSVAITQDAAALPSGYGSKYAIRFLPSGWTEQAGHSYTVTLAGTTTAVTYTIDVVDCGGGTGTTGSTTGATGTTGGRRGTTGGVGTTSAGATTGAGTTGANATTSGGGTTGATATSGASTTASGATSAGATVTTGSGATSAGATTSGAATSSGATATSGGAATSGGSVTTDTGGPTSSSSASSATSGGLGSVAKADDGLQGGCACSVPVRASAKWPALSGLLVVAVAARRRRRRD